MGTDTPFRKVHVVFDPREFEYEAAVIADSFEFPRQRSFNLGFTRACAGSKEVLMN